MWAGLETSNKIMMAILKNPHILHHKAVMVPHASIVSENEISITVLCLLYLSCLHSSTNQELFEKHVCNQSKHYEKYNGAVCPSYWMKLKYPLPFSVSYAWLITPQWKSRSVWKAPKFLSRWIIERLSLFTTKDIIYFEVYNIYGTTQHRPFATKATVKVVDNARVMCNLQQVCWNAKLIRKPPVMRFSQQIHLCTYHLMVRSQLKLTWNKHRASNKICCLCVKFSWM